jgi:hypothetical protein
MASLLAHIKIQPGKEEKWEAIMHRRRRHSIRVLEGARRLIILLSSLLQG